MRDNDPTLWPFLWHGHTVLLRSRYGTDGPPEHQAACSCRWVGALWRETGGPIDGPIEKMGFDPEFADQLRAAGGVRAWRGQRGDRFGTLDDALADLRAHIRYEPAAHAADLAATRAALTNLIFNATGSDALDDADRIAAAAADYRHQQAQYDALNPDETDADAATHAETVTS